MDVNVTNYEGRLGRHPLTCVCTKHIASYQGRAISEAITAPRAPMPITQATTCFDDPEFESEWEAHKAENEAMRELLRILL